MKKIEYQGEVYYYNKGKFFDEMYIELPISESIRLREQFLSSIDLKNLSFEEFLELVNDLENGEQYSCCVWLIENGFKLFFNNQNYAAVMLPKLFKFYRMQNQSQRVIDEWQKYWQNNYEVASAALYVVIGAAYCDLGDVGKAKQFANKAYGLLHGYPDEYLLNLYKRINALEQ